MGWLSDLLRGGGDELGWDDLIRRVVDAVSALRRFGARGESVLPAEVTVRIMVGEGSVDVVRGFTERPELDREIGAGIANRLDLPLEQLPVRDYVISAADRTTVTVVEGQPRPWELVVEGGDLGGRTVAFPPTWSELGFGRGEWHGNDHGVRNDLVVCEKTEFVSRRAGRLYRAGHAVEVVAIDQGDNLVVRRASGEALRPARTARGRVLVRIGDAIELGDGRGQTLRMLIRRVS